MIEPEIGKIYQTKGYYWMFYPSKEVIDIVLSSVKISVEGIFVAKDFATAESLSSFWKVRSNLNVSYLVPNSFFCLLEQKENAFKVLSTNGNLGWIIYSKKERWKNAWIEEVINQ